MRASQLPPATSHPTARTRQQPSALTQPSPPASAANAFSTSTHPPPAPSLNPPRSFASAIAPLHDLFTYAYPVASASAPPGRFVLSARADVDCLLLTATDLSSLYQARISERQFDDKCRRLNFGAGAERYSGLCDLLRQCADSNTEAQQRVTHSVSGVRGRDCSAAVLQLTFTLRVGSGAGLDVECAWKLPSLLRRLRQCEPTEERKEEEADDPKRSKRRAAAEDELDSLDFPDLPDELLAASSRPLPSASHTAASHSAEDDEYVYCREVALIVHRLLDLRLAHSDTSQAAPSGGAGGVQGGAALEVVQLKEQVRLLEQQVATQTERAERTEQELRSMGGGGGVGGNGVASAHDVTGKRKPRQMSERSVINPGVKRRKARGIHLEP
ncbi:hypothetical protein MMC34_008605 [Xylographa carneopallida]|nr:hypothetical protein [Xylographa carneopallida]